MGILSLMRRVRFPFGSRVPKTKKRAALPTVPHHEVTYCKELCLGCGSFGRVYLGMLYGELVAIKVPIQNSECPGAWEIFMHEVSVLQGHSHQNVISFKGFCLDPPCIITEYCPNGSLFDLLRSQEYERFGWPSRLNLAIGVARGMMFLHCQKRPIIHRDLKSSNVVLKQDNTPVITDLGLAGTISQQHLEGMLPTWQAPEVAGDGEEATLKSDVYSFAIILWEILTGEHPWKELHPMAVLFQIIQGSRPTIPEDLPDDWKGLKKYLDLMERCWAHDPSQRPTFKDIWQELGIISSDAGLERNTDPFGPLRNQASDSPPTDPGNVGPKTLKGCFQSFFLCHSF